MILEQGAIVGQDGALTDEATHLVGAGRVARQQRVEGVESHAGEREAQVRIQEAPFTGLSGGWPRAGDFRAVRWPALV